MPGTEDETYFISADSLTQGFSDTESTSLSVRGITASNGSLSFQASTPTQEEGWTFTPNKDFNNQQGNVEINYVLDDGSNGYIFATNTLSLIAVNDAPVLSTGNLSNLRVLEDSGTTSLGLEGIGYDQGGGNDENTQSLTYKITTTPDPTKGSIYYTNQNNERVAVSTDQTFTDIRDIQSLEFTTNPNAEGNTSFSFSVIDSANTAGEGELSQTISISISGVNDLPIKKTASFNINGAQEDAHSR